MRKLLNMLNMRKCLPLLAAILLLTACQETLEERCAREARLYSEKNCPVPIAKGITIDSLTFDAATHTLTYCYTLSGELDDSAIINDNNPTEEMLKQVKNNMSLKPYKDAGYNISYVYFSEKSKGTRLFEATFHQSDYNKN